MRIVKVLVALGCLLVVLPASAQRAVFKPIIRGTASERVVAYPVRTPFEQALRAGGLSYMVPNSRVGAEALNKGVTSKVGTPSFKVRLKRKAYEVCARHFNPVKVETLLARHLIQEPFPAYFNSFEDSWADFAEQVGGKLGTLEVILEAAYGPEEQFEGMFLETYREVVQLSKQVLTQGTTAAKALENAYIQGAEKEKGFFVIRVQATAEHAQDVLLLDLHHVKEIQFISLRQSIGGEWMDTNWMEKE